MTTFFMLMPHEPLDKAAWERSDYVDVCGIYADGVAEARQMAAEEFSLPGQRRHSPWLDPMLSICREAAMWTPWPDDYKGVHFRSGKRKSEAA